MNLIDFSKSYTSDKKSLHSQFFPANIMSIVAGRTGSGKTNLIMNLLPQPGLLSYSFVHVYSATLYQEAYVYLRSYYDNISKYIHIQLCWIPAEEEYKLELVSDTKDFTTKEQFEEYKKERQLSPKQKELQILMNE